MGSHTMFLDCMYLTWSYCKYQQFLPLGTRQRSTYCAELQEDCKCKSNKNCSITCCMGPHILASCWTWTVSCNYNYQNIKNKSIYVEIQKRPLDLVTKRLLQSFRKVIVGLKTSLVALSKSHLFQCQRKAMELFTWLQGFPAPNTYLNKVK